MMPNALGKCDINRWVVGLIWGAVWMVIVSLLTMLITGLVMVPAIGAAAVAGALIGIVHVFMPPQQRHRNNYGLLALGAAILMALLSGFKPFSLSLDVDFIPQIIALLIWAGIVTWSLALGFADYQSGTEKRYRVEVLLIRFLKG